MEIKEFRELLITKLKERMENNAIIPTETLKNNGIMLTGLTIKEKNTRIAPTIYIERYYQISYALIRVSMRHVKTHSISFSEK